MSRVRVGVAVLVVLSGAALAAAQQGAAPPAAQAGAGRQAALRVESAPPPSTSYTPPRDYVIGPDDLLSIQFWSPIQLSKDKDPSGDVVVRPDGKISLPLVNDIDASGLTPDQLRARIVQALGRYIEDPNVTVVVKQVNSRKVFITGNVVKAGAYTLTDSLTALQLISLAGGLNEFASQKSMRIMRRENGQVVTYPFNYKDVIKGKNLAQTIELRPGDTLIVP